MSQTVYYPGGYEPGALAQNMAEEWNDATQQFTSWDVNGNILATRPYNAQETAAYEVQLSIATLNANQATIQANVQANMATIEAWITAHPTGAVLTAAQTLVLAKMLFGIGLILNQEFSSTTGT